MVSWAADGQDGNGLQLEKNGPVDSLLENLPDIFPLVLYYSIACLHLVLIWSNFYPKTPKFL